MLQKAIYFLAVLCLVSCSKDNMQLRMQEDEALQLHNRDFFNNNQDFYRAVEKRMITAKAQGSEPIDVSIYHLLDSQCIRMHEYFYATKRGTIGLKGINYYADRLEVISAIHLSNRDEKIEWDKVPFENEIRAFFKALKSIPETDFFHQKLLQSDLINYQRKYTEKALLDELSELERSILTASEEIPPAVSRLTVFEFINLTNSSILLAERKVLRFLEEHYANYNNLNYPGNFETIISSDKITVAPGSKLQMDIFPSFISNPNLFVKRYAIIGPEINDSFLIKGQLSAQTDTIWLPTERIGDYKIRGSAMNFMRPSQAHEFEYNYKVIAE